MNDGHPASQLDDEQEVDLSSALAAPEAALVAADRGSRRRRGDRPRARALRRQASGARRRIVYLGQPFAPLGGGQIQSLATNPRTVGEIVRSEAVVQRVSRETGIPASKLRSSISTKELHRARPAARGINPLIEIGVKGDAGPRKIEQAANALAARVVDDVSRLRPAEGRAPRAAGRGERVAARGGRGADPGGAAAADADHPGPVDPARPAAAAEREPELGDHDRGRAPDRSPGRPLRGRASS